MKISKLIFQIFLFIAFLNLLDCRKKKKKELIDEDYDFEDDPIEKNKKIKQYKVSQMENNRKIQEARERAKKVKESPSLKGIEKLNEQQFEEKIGKLPFQKKEDRNAAPEIEVLSSKDDEHKLIEKYFINVLWGDIYNENTEKLQQFERLAYQGILICYKLKVAAEALGIDVNQFNDMGIDKANELVYPGVIKFKDEKTSEHYYQAFTACCSRQNITEETPTNTEEMPTNTEKIPSNEKSNHEEL